MVRGFLILISTIVMVFAALQENSEVKVLSYKDYIFAEGRVAEFVYENTVNCEFLNWKSNNLTYAICMLDVVKPGYWKATGDVVNCLKDGPGEIDKRTREASALGCFDILSYAVQLKHHTCRHLMIAGTDEEKLNYFRGFVDEFDYLLGQGIELPTKKEKPFAIEEEVEAKLKDRAGVLSRSLGEAMGKFYPWLLKNLNVTARTLYSFFDAAKNFYTRSEKVMLETDFQTLIFSLIAFYICCRSVIVFTMVLYLRSKGPMRATRKLTGSCLWRMFQMVYIVFYTLYVVLFSGLGRLRRELQPIPVVQLPEEKKVGILNVVSKNGRMVQTDGEGNMYEFPQTLVELGLNQIRREVSPEESMLSTSEMRVVKDLTQVPRYICVFLTEDGTTIGHAYRTQDTLVTAKHVYTALPDKFLVLTSGVKNNQAFQLEKSSLEILYDMDPFDVIQLKPAMKLFSILGMTNVDCEEGRINVTAQLYCYFDREWYRSTGRVTKDGDKFCHNASTRPGSSGTPVITVTKVLGVHTRAAIQGEQEGRNYFEHTFYFNKKLLEKFALRMNGPVYEVILGELDIDLEAPESIEKANESPTEESLLNGKAYNDFKVIADKFGIERRDQVDWKGEKRFREGRVSELIGQNDLPITPGEAQLYNEMEEDLQDGNVDRFQRNLEKYGGLLKKRVKHVHKRNAREANVVLKFVGKPDVNQHILKMFTSLYRDLSNDDLESARRHFEIIEEMMKHRPIGKYEKAKESGKNQPLSVREGSPDRKPDVAVEESKVSKAVARKKEDRNVKSKQKPKSPEPKQKEELSKKKETVEEERKRKEANIKRMYDEQMLQLEKKYKEERIKAAQQSGRVKIQLPNILDVEPKTVFNEVGEPEIQTRLLGANGMGMFMAQGCPVLFSEPEQMGAVSRIGKARGVKNAMADRLTKETKEVIQLFKLDKYKLANPTDESEIRSLKYYLNRSEERRAGVAVNLKQVVQALLPSYVRECIPVHGMMYEDSAIFERHFGEEGPRVELKEDFFRKMLSTVKGNSSPGVPYMYTRGTNADWIEKDFYLLKEMTERRIATMLSVRLGEELDFQTKMELVDPVRVFVKNEPTTKEYDRLIFSVSLVDQIIDRIIYTPAVEKDLVYNENCTRNGRFTFNQSTVGIDLNTTENNKLFHAEVVNRMKDSGDDYVFMTNDCSGFEYNIELPLREAYESYQIGVLQRNHSKHSRVLKMMQWRLYLTTQNVVLMSSGGSLFEKKGCSILSGAFITSSMGTFVRSFMSYIVSRTRVDGLQLEVEAKVFNENLQRFYFNGKFIERCDQKVHFVKANGDDCIERQPKKGRLDEDFSEEMRLHYLRLGVTITDTRIVRKDDKINFCSHNFYADRKASPEGYAKALINMTQQKVDVLFKGKFQDFEKVYVRQEQGCLSEEDFDKVLEVMAEKLEDYTTKFEL